MSLLEMSLSGGVLILAIVVVRALVLDRLPKWTFLALWGVALARLLIPLSLPSPLSIWSFVAAQPTLQIPPASGTATMGSPSPSLGAVSGTVPAATASPVVPATSPAAASASGGTGFPVWTAVWLAGLCLCALFFLIAYVRCRWELRASLPVDEVSLEAWRQDHRLLRPMAIRQSDRISAPMTYGLFQPVILLPKAMDWSDQERIAYVLEHEFMHIRRFDALTKLVLAAGACVHWFNPLVWVMLVLANRDIELSCDEAVVRRFGVEKRAGYAKALINMEARKSGLGPFASAFNRNAIEERITAIMRMKKTSLLAMVLAVVLVCAMGAAFVTSAAEKPEDPREYLTALPGDEFTEEESRRLFSLWFAGYEDMTVADYRAKMRSERTDGDMELIERFSLSETAFQLPAGKEADALAAFNDYFFNVYEPLTADRWESRDFDSAGANGVGYQYTLRILSPDALTVGDYERIHREAEAFLRQPMADTMDAFEVDKLSTEALQVELGYYLSSFRSDGDLDAALHAAFSQQTAAEWDRLLTPYVPLGLTYTFDDPDNDGNGLTMWFGGREVRGILDEQEGLWITEHAGITTYASDAIELRAVYTDGVLTELRPATAEEQAAFTEDRVLASAAAGLLGNTEEQREFPNATRADYDSILALRTEGYEDMMLEDFNQRLLDWCNENGDAFDRISCDVIWDDCAVDLTEEEWRFVSHTCRLSSKENAMMIRSLYTGQPEEDPGFAANLPMLTAEASGVTAAWCDLYYDLTYHISDRSAVTVRERDNCIADMVSAIQNFWQDTDLDTLLTMSEADVVAQFNAWAEHCNTNHVSFCHVTEHHIHYECMDERPFYDEYLPSTVHHVEPESHQSHHSDTHHG